MAIGAPNNKETLDSVLVSMITRLRDAFEVVGEQAEKWAARTDEEIEALGYSAAEVDLARTAVLALEQLRLVAYGQATVPNADNFFFNADKLTAWQ